MEDAPQMEGACQLCPTSDCVTTTLPCCRPRRAWWCPGHGRRTPMTTCLGLTAGAMQPTPRGT
eukprot:1158319-Pelagomonas_calceolata.AAC.3